MRHPPSPHRRCGLVSKHLKQTDVDVFSAPSPSNFLLRRTNSLLFQQGRFPFGEAACSLFTPLAFITLISVSKVSLNHICYWEMEFLHKIVFTGPSSLQSSFEILAWVFFLSFPELFQGLCNLLMTWSSSFSSKVKLPGLLHQFPAADETDHYTLGSLIHQK